MGLPWDPITEHSAPEVHDDLVFICPGNGIVVAVGRFDGKIRWLVPYPSLDRGPARQKTPSQLNKERQRVRQYLNQVETYAQSGRSPPGLPAQDVLDSLQSRFIDTPQACDQAVLCAPSDAPQVAAYDPLTGRRLWQTDQYALFTLFGHTRDTVFLQEESIIALDAATGTRKWEWRPGAGAITGAAIVHNDLIIIPTTTGPVAINATTGANARVPDGCVNFRRITAADPAFIQHAGASGSFGLPSP
jgi:hypothetical protein